MNVKIIYRFRFLKQKTKQNLIKTTKEKKKQCKESLKNLCNTKQELTSRFFRGVMGPEAPVRDGSIRAEGQQ